MSEQEKLNLFIPLEKVDAEKRIVYGTIASEEPDGAGEIMDYALSKAEFARWSSEMEKASGGSNLGNVREMHGKTAVGKLISIDFNDDLKKISAAVKIVDDAAWEKVQEGVYTGFSPGGGYAKRWKDPTNPKLMRYVPALVELSVVDSPCMKSATFQYVKANGIAETRSFQNVILSDFEPGFRAKDGTFFVDADLAKLHNKKLAKAAAKAETSHPALETLKEVQSAVATLELTPEQALAKAAAEKDKPPAKYRLKKDAKAEAGPKLQKGLMEVSRLAALISELQWLCESVEIEAKMEGDSGVAAGSLEQDVKGLSATLAVMVSEEVAEMQDCPGDMGKMLEGFALEKFQRETLGKIEPLKKVLSFVKDVEPAAATPDPVLEKLNQTLAQATEQLSKANQTIAAKDEVITGLHNGLGDLKKRLEVIERTPMPPRGPLRAVDRETERKAPTQEKPQQGPAQIMPPGLSPRDQRAYLAAQQNKNRNN